MSAYNPPLSCPGGATLTFNTPKGSCSLTASIIDAQNLKVKTSNFSICCGWSLSVNYLTTITSVGFCFLGSGVALVYRELYKGVSSTRILKLTCYDGFSFSDVTDASVEFLTAEEQISFKRLRKQVAKEISDLHFAQANPPAPNPTDPTDPSETPDPSNPSTPSKDSILAGFKDPMFWGLMGMLGIIRNETGYDASKVDPEALIKQLQDLLNKTQTDPEPTPTEAPEPTPTEQPQPEPEPSEATKPTTSPDTPTDPPSDEEDLGKAHPADWKGVFPFCVPFDLIEFLGILAAEPEAPVIRWRFFVPNVVDQEIVLDLSVFDSVAQIVRTMELLAFCVGLILLTRNIIRG